MVLAALLVVTLQAPPAPAPASAPAASLRPARAARANPATLVTRALDAIGGADAVRAIPALTLEYYSTNFGIGQEETPGSPARATVSTGRQVTDWTNARRAQFVETRTPANPQPQRQRRVTANGISMLEAGANAQQQADPPNVVTNIARQMRTAPERLLVAAAEHPEALTAIAAREWRGDMADGARYAFGPDTLNLYFDRISGLLLGVEQVTDDPILGDRSTATMFTRWQDVPGATGGNVKVPRQIDVAVNDRLQSHTVVSSATIGAAPDSLFVIPDSIAARAQRPAPGAVPPPVPVILVELAPGVWRAEGGTHFSLIVEQPTQLVVVEAPQTSARSQSLLDTLKARFPGKAVGVVVNTHHHWDHSGGLRGFMAASVPVLTQRRNLAFVRGIAAAKKTIAPDALSRRPRQPVIRAMDDTTTIGSGDTRVVIYRIPTTHVEGMLAAYVPAARLLFTSDVLSPGATLAALGSSEVAALARTRGIAVERVAGGHGGIASWPDVERAAGN
jgi:glyoxylase-like metal-dependent hydrolase (beta-lactamase superfamily II)